MEAAADQKYVILLDNCVVGGSPAAARRLFSRAQFAFELFVQQELHGTFGTTPVTGLNALVKAFNSLFVVYTSNNIAIPLVRNLSRTGGIHVQLHARSDHPNGIGECIAGNTSQSNKQHYLFLA